MVTTELHATRATAATDRRRAGRLDSVSPQLLTLLRAEERARLAPLEPTDHPSERRLDAGQAVVLAAGLGALLWAALIAAAWTALTA